jgi:hypothetical protein
LNVHRHRSLRLTVPGRFVRLRLSRAAPIPLILSGTTAASRPPAAPRPPPRPPSARHRSLRLTVTQAGSSDFVCLGPPPFPSSSLTRRPRLARPMPRARLRARPALAPPCPHPPPASALLTQPVPGAGPLVDDIHGAGTRPSAPPLWALTVEKIDYSLENFGMDTI